jgi:predicted O-methyltransferase YrrM
MMFSMVAFVRFYARAVTKYQIHSPFVFELVQAVLEDERWYYAFRDIEVIRQQMYRSEIVLDMQDFGTRGQGAIRQVSLRNLARQAGSSTDQGRMLFRLIQHLQPKTILELGTNLGIGAMYMATAARAAKFISLEGSEACAQVARTNLAYLSPHHGEVRAGEFGTTLQSALADLASLDAVFIDGNHHPAPTYNYFEQCLAASNDRTVFIFDDMHSSAGMEHTWRQIQAHDKVTLTIDFFELSLVFVHPDFKVKQHFDIVRTGLKPWKIW